MGGGHSSDGEGGVLVCKMGTLLNCFERIRSKKKWRPQEPETLRANWGGPVEREDMPCAMCYVRLAQ